MLLVRLIAVTAFPPTVTFNTKELIILKAFPRNELKKIGKAKSSIFLYIFPVFKSCWLNNS